jgi:hypothetical protein
MKSMNMKRQFIHFEKVIDCWNRKRLRSLDADDYRIRSIFAEFAEQMEKIFT